MDSNTKCMPGVLYVILRSPQLLHLYITSETHSVKPLQTTEGQIIVVVLAIC